MNPSPFSLETIFSANDAREDKIDLEIRGWEVYGLNPNQFSVHEFKSFMSCPPDKLEDSDSEAKKQYGWFFCRPDMHGQTRDRLVIRSQSPKASKETKRQRKEATALCGGHCLFYPGTKPQPVTGECIYYAKVRLSLNLQRFIRHQAQKDDPLKPWKLRLRKREENLSVHGDEFSLDGQDNWLPNSAAWRKFAAKDFFENYINLILEEVDSNIQRACNAITPSEELSDDWATVQMERQNTLYSLSEVETIWEFLSDDPIGDVYDIGAKLMQLTKKGGGAKFYPCETSRTCDSPCFTVTIAENVVLKLYAKTNCRLRFEIVHTELRKRPKQTKKQPKYDLIFLKEEDRSLEELPGVIKALRESAADHMNQVMTLLRAGRDGKVKACSVVQLLTEVASAVHSSTLVKQKRQSMIQTILFFLCYQHGFRGNLRTGSYAPALAILEERDVIKFDRPRQFYVLSPTYIPAADALVSATGDSFSPIFGTDMATFQQNEDGKIVRRLRE